MHLYQMCFEKDTFVEKYIGGYEYIDEDRLKYYIQDKAVEKKDYKKWEKSILDDEVDWYTPVSK